METTDGGPAFPAKTRDGKEFGDDFTTGGMSLRDYFAAAALQGTLSHAGNSLKDPQPVLEYARKAYEIADAMLAVR